MTEAYVTLATNDRYALGALVLAHSLRSVNTTRQICILISPGVSEAVRSQLSNVFNNVVSVDVMDSNDTAHLALLKRPELGVTFTKLHCWTLTQYTKCVFLDADILAIQNADELFDQPELSAVSDIGWPDCFNSGVFVFSPSEDTYNSLLQLAETTGSFDGGDQGLLNTYFTNWNRLSFIYNMVASVTYTYLPAYKQFGKDVKFVHFLGATKPWQQSYHSSSGTVISQPGQEHISSHLNTWWRTFAANVRPTLPDSVSEYLVADHSIVPEDKDAHHYEQHHNPNYFTYHTNDYHHTDQQVINQTGVGSNFDWQPVFIWPPSHVDTHEDSQTEDTYNALSPFIPYMPPPDEGRRTDPEQCSEAESGHDTQDFGESHASDSHHDHPSPPTSFPFLQTEISSFSEAYSGSVTSPHRSASPTPTPTHIPTPVPTPTPTPLPTPVPTPQPTPIPTPLPTPIPTPQPTPVPTPLPTPIPTPLPTPIPTPLPTPIPTPTHTPTLTPPITPISTPTPQQSPSSIHTPTPVPTTTVPKIFQQLALAPPTLAPPKKLVPELRQKAREGEYPVRRPAFEKRGRVPLPAQFHSSFQPFINPRHPSPFSGRQTARAVPAQGPPNEVTEQLSELKISPEKDLQECQERWEQGRPDYTGEDSFDNILAHIDSKINNN